MGIRPEVIRGASWRRTAGLELGQEAARDIPRLLRAHGYLDPDLEARWVKMIGFRNILVHDCLEVDRERVWTVLQEDLEDVRALARVFARFL